MSEQQHSGWKFDKTVNLPTLVTIISLVVGGTQAYASVKADAARANERIEALDRRQRESDQNTAQQFSTFRAEARADNQTMMGKIDQVIFRLGEAPRNLKAWTK